MTTTELERARTAVLCAVAAESRVLCAVSGGLDSMCLLHFMTDWGRMWDFSVTAAHFNHRLRPTADRDEAFVGGWCADRGVPFVSGRGDVRKAAAERGLSVEEAARELRYAFLKETAAREGCAFILTAHHADDSAETMLLNLIRGTGLRGLAGIPQEHGNVLRPFVELPRRELEAYAAAHAIPHVEDETNADPDAAARNLIRLRVMPLLREVNPRTVEHMTQTARQLSAIDRTLEEEACRRTARVENHGGRVELRFTDLLCAPVPLRPRMLARMLDILGVGRKDFGAVHLEAILSMAGQTGIRGKESRLSLPRGVTARYAREWLILETRPQPMTEAQLLENCPLRWGGYTLTLLSRRTGEGLALRERTAEESAAVTVAPCVPGDRLTLPETHGGSRSVKRLCLDRRIGLSEREGLPAIYAGGRLAAVWRLGVDVEFLPQGEPCRFIQIAEET